MGIKLSGWQATGTTLAVLMIAASGAAAAHYTRDHTTTTTTIVTAAHLAIDPGVASGTVTGGDLTPRLYTPGTDQPSTALPGFSSNLLPAGTQVDLVCYFTGQPIAGPEALAATDPFWDETGDLGLSLKAGQVVVVADAFVHTDRPVDQMIPACGSGGPQPQPQTPTQTPTQPALPPAPQPSGGCGSETSAS